jgi:hypothetical protein
MEKLADIADAFGCDLRHGELSFPGVLQSLCLEGKHLLEQRLMAQP